MRCSPVVISSGFWLTCTSCFSPVFVRLDGSAVTDNYSLLLAALLTDGIYGTWQCFYGIIIMIVSSFTNFTGFSGYAMEMISVFNDTG